MYSLASQIPYRTKNAVNVCEQGLPCVSCPEVHAAPLSALRRFARTFCRCEVEIGDVSVGQRAVIITVYAEEGNISCALGLCVEGFSAPL